MEKLNQGLINLFDGQQAFKHLEFMESLGPRTPDSNSHKALEKYIENAGSKTKAQFYKQEYYFDFCGKKTFFANLIYIFEGKNKNKKKILLGTHYDSRIIADRETDPELRNHPIMGINDGGSGTAVFIELLNILDNNQPDNDIALVFFDAEDIGNIDGYNFSEGAQYFADNFELFNPDEVVVIDMIGGIDACYQLDYEAYDSKISNPLLVKLWKTGIFLNLPQFTTNKDFNGSYFICDHTPFVKKNIPSMILIDINYKWWHTQEDIIKHCSPDSLSSCGKVLLFYIYGFAEFLNIS